MLVEFVRLIVQSLKDCDPFAATIFNISEFKEHFKLDIADIDVENVFLILEKMNILIKVNKFSSGGQYYNVTPVTVKLYSANKPFSTWVWNKFYDEESGYCAATKSFMKCKGEECKYFMPRFKQCVLGKDFI